MPMQNGDISNKAAPYIGFDIDSLLFVESNYKTVWTSIREAFKSSKRLYIDRKLDSVFVATLREIWTKHNVNVVLLTGELEEEDLPELADRLDHGMVPFSNLYSYVEAEDLRNTMHNLQYFFSSNEMLISFLSANHAKHINAVREVFGNGKS
jgi:hypothetical protein